jgi:hypothetical protein
LESVSISIVVRAVVSIIMSVPPWLGCEATKCSARTIAVGKKARAVAIADDENAITAGDGSRALSLTWRQLLHIAL